MNDSARTFEIAPAERKAVGLLIGLVGPSSSGKTFSALRLASGIQRVCGGEIDFIDTENGRALYYADRFKFNHLRFAAPFSPDDYLEAIRFCARRGSKTIVIDSMSHEHEGPGGVLEWHEAEIERLMKLWKTNIAEKVQLAAWSVPKRARIRLIQEALQLNVNLIMTFRAKEKLKVIPGKPPQPLGWQPIGGEEWKYELAFQALLLPGSDGRPVWRSDLESERNIMKLPAQFDDIYDRDKPAQFTEEIGERMARWASGGSGAATPAADPVDSLVTDYAKCASQAAFDALEARRTQLWTKARGGEKQRLKEASDKARGRLPAKLDSADWIAQLRAATDAGDLQVVWDSINEALALVPLEIEAVYHERKETLKLPF